MGNSYNLCYHLPSGIDASCSKSSHFGSNLEEPASLRTPSYVLLAGLAITDFCTGLLCQPFYVLNKLGELTGRVKLSCIATIVVTNASGHFVSLTGIVMTIIAVEIWLHMS